MDSINLESCLIAILNEMKNMNNKLEVLISEIEELKEIERNTNVIFNNTLEDEQSEQKRQVLRDSKGRILGLTPEDFYNMRRQGYSLAKITRLTGWSVSHIKPLIYEVERQRGEK